MLINKIKNKIKSITRESFYVTKNFGFRYGFTYLSTSIFRKYQYKRRLLGISILENEFSYLFDSINLSNDYFIYDNSQKNIFLYWAQGFDKLPGFQKNVLTRIRKYYNDYNIILIDDNNYDSYVNLSARIKDLYRSNKISVQTFSDILRFNLIYKYGGVWCDMTNLFFDRLDFDHYISQIGFWSINHDSYEKEILWSKVYPVTYTTFLFGSAKNNDIMKICVNFYNDYYEKHDFCIDYFMNDLILIICMKKKMCNNLLNRIPYTKSSPFLLTHLVDGNYNIKLDDLRECPQKINNKAMDFTKLKDTISKLEGYKCVM